jgi:hypothetical protein
MNKSLKRPRPIPKAFIGAKFVKVVEKEKAA